MTDPHETESIARLWHAVVLQAIRDAHANVRGDRSREIALERRQARAWVRTDDFRQVCSMAGVNPVKVLAAILGPRHPQLDSLQGNRAIRRTALPVHPDMKKSLEADGTV